MIARALACWLAGASLALLTVGGAVGRGNLPAATPATAVPLAAAMLPAAGE